MTTPNTLTKEGLRQFTGSETWWRHWLVRDVLYTDGAKHVAEAGEAYWLLDEIAFAQRDNAAVKREEFQVWKLTVDLAKSTGTLTCDDGNGHGVFRKAREFTDFPLDEITLWYINKTIFLPSEY